MAGPKWAGWCAKRIFALIRRDFLLAMAGTALPPEEFSGLIGQPATALERVYILGPVRIIRPGDAVTGDVIPRRINFDLDATDRIMRIFCG